jgi:hypothetical protein
MQTTLRLDDQVHRHAKAEAARRGITLTQFIEEALRAKIAEPDSAAAAKQAEIRERNQLMEALLHRTAHFKLGEKLTREQMHERPGLR